MSSTACGQELPSMSVEITPIPLGFDTCYVLRAGGVIAIDPAGAHVRWIVRLITSMETFIDQTLRLAGLARR